MPDIVIHRCRVRVLRRGGWSWGPTPRELVDDVIRRLPQLLAARFADQAEEGGDVELSETLRIRVRVKLDALGKLQGGDAETATLVESPLALTSKHEKSRRGTPLPLSFMELGASNTARSHNAVAPALPAFERSALATLLLSWHRRGFLGPLMRRLDPQTLSDWDAVLSSNAPVPHVEEVERDASMLDTAVNVVLAKLGRPPDEQYMRHLFRLILAVEAATALNREVDDIALWRAIERALPATMSMTRELANPLRATTDAPNASALAMRPEAVIDSAHTNAPIDIVAPMPTERRLTKHADAISRASLIQSPAQSWETQVGCVLPFLMLGPLADIGFFDAVAATLEVEELENAWPAFAAALAYKALAAPDARCRRSAGVHHDGAVFAGSSEPIAEIAVSELARQTRGMLSALQAVIAHAIVKEHPAGQPLLIHAVEEPSGWLLVEPASAYPIAWADQVERLLDWQSLVEGEIVLLPREAAEPAFVQKLNDNGVRFIVDAPPTRSDTWRCLRSGQDRWWTNDAMTPQSVLVRQARLMADADETAAIVWRTLGADRPTAILAPHSDLDRTLTLAAALALGRIAWELWREREPIDPLLTLSRFASLSGRVQFQEDQVRVTLPMGRRSWDLGEHRLLDDVPNLPWLGGRTVVFHVG